MNQFDNSSETTDYTLNTDGCLNLTKYEDLNASHVNKSCVNISSEFLYKAGVFTSDADRLLSSIYYNFVYTVSPLGLIVNILNIVAIAHSPQGPTPHSILIISLAVSDICVVLPTLGTQLMCHLYLYERVVDLTVLECYAAFEHISFEPCVLLASLFNLLALGIDHYIAIVKPLHCNRLVSNRRTKVIIVLIWIVSFIAVVIDTIPSIFAYYKADDTGQTFCSYMRINHSPRIPYFLVIPVFFVLIALYARIFIAYKKYAIRRQSFRPDNLHNNKAIITTLLIIGSFMIGWVSYSALRVSFVLFRQENIHLKCIPPLRLVYYSVCCALIKLNSLCDALIYALRLQIVKQGYIAMFRKLCRKFQRWFKRQHCVDHIHCVWSGLYCFKDKN